MTDVNPLDPATWPPTCSKCGVTLTRVRQCLGHSKRDGKHCGDAAAIGHTVCRRHGARTPQAKAAAERRIADDAARRAAAVYGLPIEVDPHEALLQELHRTAGHVAWLGAELEALPSKGFLYQRTKDGWRPAAQVEVYQAERKHLASVAAACLKAGVEERRVQIAQQQADVLVTVLRGVLSDLGVADHPDVSAVVGRHLRAVAS